MNSSAGSGALRSNRPFVFVLYLSFVTISLIIAGCGGGASPSGAGSALMPSPDGKHRQATPSAPASVSSPAPTPPSAPVPGAPAAAPETSSVPNHVMTGAEVAGYKGTTVAPTRLAPYLTWAENPSEENAPSVKSAGLKISVYTNPNREYPCDGCSWLYPLTQQNPQVYAKDCSGNLIRVAFGTGEGFLTDPRVPLMTDLFRQEIAHAQSITAVTWDAFYEDDTDTASYTLNGLPCNYSKSAWTAASLRQTAAQNVPIIINGLNNGISELPFVDLPNVIGGMWEACYSYPAGGYYGNPNEGAVPLPDWSITENMEIALAQRGKLFWCAAQASDSAYRIFEYASFMLTYSQSSSLLQTDHPTPSNFPVFPETQLVATNPVVATPNDVSALQVTPEVYAREYRACYQAGQSIGPCAFVVNPGTDSHPWPYGTKYGHTIVLRGGGVLESGSMSTNGPSPPTTLPAGSAVIAFP